MGLRFIFMLTRNDRTVADAEQQLQTALSLGIRHIGFKDIGLPLEQLQRLNAAIKAGGATSYLEVVSLDRESEITSARAAVSIGVDMLLGGTRVDDVLPIIAGSHIQYFPFPGRITGHPSVLEGSIDEIVASAREICAHDGVHGLDLLAYRSKENVPALMAAVCSAVRKPVYVAGSISSPDRIAIVKAAGAAGFTIGTAALDGQYPADGKDEASQLAAIIRDVAALNQHLSPLHKNKLPHTEDSMPQEQPDKVKGQISQMKVSLNTIENQASWSFRKSVDELFFVHRGRLLMKLRDREEVVEESEFIMVPHGVEYCPVALDGARCEVLKIDSVMNQAA